MSSGPGVNNGVELHYQFEAESERESRDEKSQAEPHHTRLLNNNNLLHFF